MTLAEEAGLHTLADQRLSVSTDKGCNPRARVTSLVAGMIAGADSIDDMGLLRHGGMNTLFTGRYAPSPLGSFLRAFTFGHVRQLDTIASRTLTNLSTQTPLITRKDPDDYVYVDVDDTLVEIHGHQKQGSGYGYSGVRGLNAILATSEVGFGRVRLVGQHGISPGARSAGSTSRDPQSLQQRIEHGRVTVLAGSADGDQRQSVAIDETMRFRRQLTSRAPDRVIKRLVEQILVFRRVPFLGV